MLAAFCGVKSYKSDRGERIHHPYSSTMYHHAPTLHKDYRSGVENLEKVSPPHKFVELLARQQMTR